MARDVPNLHHAMGHHQEVIATYRKPFDIIASAGSVNKKGQGADALHLASCPVEYPQRESNPYYHCERVVS
jgi:hypothetical protein